MSDLNVSTLVATYYMKIALSVSAITFAKTYKQGKTVVATHDNASEDAFRVSRSLIPPGFDSEYKALTKAINQCRAVFNRFAVTVGTSADGKKADGDKVIPSKVYADGSFLAEWNPAYAEFTAAHANFVSNYPSIVQAIQHASQYGSALGNSFDLSEYPDVQAVREGFAITLEGPFPIADARGFTSLPINRDIRQALESQYEAYQKRLVANASQSLAKDMAEYLSNMATNLSKLTEFYRTPEHLRSGKRQPAIYDSLVTNLQDAVAKARAFAIPETESGSKLMDLVDQIEATLNPDALSADLLKSNPIHAGKVANDAAALAAALDACDWDY